jgi:hypothetical protein
LAGRFDRQIVEKLFMHMQLVAIALTAACAGQSIGFIFVITATEMAAEDHIAAVEFSQHHGIEILDIIPAVIQTVVGFDLGLIFTAADAADIGIIATDDLSDHGKNYA